MLFKPEHVEMIKTGKKTATRRNWKRQMVKVGGIYFIKTKMLSKKNYGKIKVLDVYREDLCDMDDNDAKKEGYNTLGEFVDVWRKINGTWDSNQKVYVIDFEVIK
jgi:hypothetical protein